MTCPHCTAALPDDDLFCEECGQRLANEPTLLTPLCLCGAPEGDLDDDGYCLQCGRRCRPFPGEHEEKDLSPDFAAVTDRGLRHHRNEDRFEIAAESGCSVLVVCDGVSNSSRADEAAALAASSLAGALLRGDDIEHAYRQAAEAVGRLGHEFADVAPSTCAVAARVENNCARVGWIGDARAYWIGQQYSRQLTTDHSWLNEVVSSGEFSYAEAAKAPQAHGVTRWIGADVAAETLADVTTFDIPGEGWLVLCSDGLWNYATTQDLADLILAFPTEAGALEIARHLTAFANERGGNDNITVALLRFIC